MYFLSTYQFEYCHFPLSQILSLIGLKIEVMDHAIPFHSTVTNVHVHLMSYASVYPSVHPSICNVRQYNFSHMTQ